VVTKLKEIKLDSHDIMVSFDVISLFPNVPISEVVKIIRKKWNEIEPYTKIKSKETFIEGIKLVTQNNYFSFNNKLYRQTHGLAMGGCMSVNLSGLVLNLLLENVLEKLSFKPKLFLKYIDDCLVILPADKVEELHEKLNQYHPRLQFTVEKEVENTLNSLDVTIIREKDSFKFKWYTKKIASGRLLNYMSHHPHHQKINVACNMINKAKQLTSPEFLSEIQQKIFDTLRKNCYPIKLIKNIWYKPLENVESSKIKEKETIASITEDKTKQTSLTPSRNNQPKITNF